MSVALYMDENVQGQVVDGLRRLGADVLTVFEDEREGIPDPKVLDRAGEISRLLFTQDNDLLREAHRRQESGEHFIGGVYGHQLRVTIGQIIEDLELIAFAGELSDFTDQVKYLPLSQKS